MIYNKHTKILILLVCLVIGFMLSMQLKTTNRAKNIPQQRAEDLSERLKAAEKDKEQLKMELDSLKAQSGSDVARKDFERLKALAGETALQGKGIELTIDDSSIPAKAGENKNLYILHDEDLLRVVNEIRAAGAEAIAINGQRLTATSEIRCAGPTVVINDTRVAAPFVVAAIGNPQTLESSLNIRGGVLENFKFWGIRTNLAKSDTIKIPAFKKEYTFEFAVIVDPAQENKDKAEGSQGKQAETKPVAGGKAQ